VDDSPIDLSNSIDLEGSIDRFPDWDRGIAIAEIELRSLVRTGKPVMSEKVKKKIASTT
jgi:hypothetical protein